MFTVLTFLWVDPDRARDYDFNFDHVHILKNMVERNLSIPHEFVCVTDYDIEGIRTEPLDWEKHVPGTCFVRLMMRKPGWAESIGATRCLSLDLDMVIVDDLTPIVDRPEDCVFWHNPNFPKPRRAFYQTSMQLFDAGARPELWTDFDTKETPKWVNWRFGGAEQAWVSERLDWAEAHWDHRDGVYGAGRLADWGDGVQSSLPSNARIVSFPGNREPSQPEVQEKHPWVRDAYY